MKAEKVTRVFYSATGTTNRIINAVEEGLNFEKKREVNLTEHNTRKSFELMLEKDELLIVGIPVYAGKIPDFLVPSLKKLNGDGQSAVIIAVYGNVTEGIVLEELKELLEDRGFKVIGAASFIGEHSFSDSEYNIAAGRPDISDCQKAKSFGADIGKKLEKLSNCKNIESVQINDNGGSFVTNIIEKIPIPQYGSKKFVKKPDVDMTKCINCKICAELCPVSAIDIESLRIDDSICIRCMSCVKNCPVKARNIEYKMPVLIKGFFKLNNIDKYKEPKIYI